MKKIRKLTSLLLVLVMSLALAVPCFAAGPADDDVKFAQKGPPDFGCSKTRRAVSADYLSCRYGGICGVRFGISAALPKRLHMQVTT